MPDLPWVDSWPRKQWGADREIASGLQWASSIRGTIPPQTPQYKNGISCGICQTTWCMPEKSGFITDCSLQLYILGLREVDNILKL